MHLLAVNLARALVFVESTELNPRGRSYFPDIVRGLVEKCEFVKFPQKVEDFDEKKGIEFGGGRWGDTAIQTLRIYDTGLLLDTRVSTDESERVLTEALAWASEKYGIVYAPNMISRIRYLSQLLIRTEAPILGKGSSPIAKLAQRSKELINNISGDDTDWQPTIVTLHSEQLPRKPLHAAFTIQRRVETLFAENKYYSEAPFPTDLHFSLLEKLEADSLAE